jgi:hypothetical protein
LRLFVIVLVALTTRLGVLFRRAASGSGTAAGLVILVVVLVALTPSFGMLF